MRHSLINPRDSSRYQTQCPEPFHCISNFQISGINKTSAANEYIWGLQSWNLSNFRAKATQHRSVLIKPQDKLLVCNRHQVSSAILDELLKCHWKTKCNKTSLWSWNTNWIPWNGAPRRRRNARRGWQWWNSPMRFPGARHESSIRSMRKGDSLSGVSLSPNLIPSPTLASTIFGSPAPPAVREEHPCELPDRSIGGFATLTVNGKMNQNYMSQSDDKSLWSRQRRWVWPSSRRWTKKKKKESIFTLFLNLQESST